MNDLREALKRFDRIIDQNDKIPLTVEEFEQQHPATAKTLAKLINQFVDDTVCVIKVDLGIALD